MAIESKEIMKRLFVCVVCGLILCSMCSAESVFTKGTKWYVRVTSCEHPVGGHQVFELGDEKVFEDEPGLTYNAVVWNLDYKAMSYIREDAGKVYIRIGDEFEPVLLYDFTLTPGDRAVVYDINNGNRYSPCYMECLGLDKVVYDGREYDVIRLVQYLDAGYTRMSECEEFRSQSWLVDLGSMSGLLYPYNTTGIGGASYSLDYVECGGEVIYRNETSGILNVKNEDSSNRTRYSLDGRRVAGDVRGLYISNGRVCFRK